MSDEEKARIEGFFADHPVHEFDAAKIAKYLDISERVVKIYLDDLVDRGRVVKSCTYRLKLDDETVTGLFYGDETRRKGR